MEAMDVCAHGWAPQREVNTFDLVSGSTSHIALEVISAIGVESIADCVFPVPLISRRRTVGKLPAQASLRSKSQLLNDVFSGIDCLARESRIQ